MKMSFTFLLVFTSLACGQFINPPTGSGVVEQKPVGITLVYHVGDTLDVRWNNSNKAIVDLVIKQAGTPGTQIDRTPNSAGLAIGAYTWKITTDGSDGGSAFDLSFSNAFRFNLYQTGSVGQAYSTVYFNISNSTIDQYGKKIAQASSSSSILLPTSLTTTSSASTALPLSTSPAISGTTSSSIPTPSASPEPAKPGLSTGTKIGLGVGLGIAGLGVVAGLALWYMFLRRKRSTELNRMSEPIYMDQPKPPVQQSWSPPAELQAPT